MCYYPEISRYIIGKVWRTKLEIFSSFKSMKRYKYPEIGTSLEKCGGGLNLKYFQVSNP